MSGSVWSGGRVYTVEASMFEGLYVRALRVEPGSAFAAGLKAAGYDLEAPQPLYDIQVWADCLDVAAARLHPGVERMAAWRRLGRTFIRGYFETLIGRAIAAVLPWMRPERFVERVPQFLRTGLGGSTAEVDQPTPGEAVIHLHGPHFGSAYVLSGVLEECFERMGVQGEFAPVSLDALESRVDVRWPPPGGP